MGGSEANNNRRLRSRPKTNVSFPPRYILLLDDRAVNNVLEEINEKNNIKTRKIVGDFRLKISVPAQTKKYNIITKIVKLMKIESSWFYIVLILKICCIKV